MQISGRRTTMRSNERRVSKLFPLVAFHYRDYLTKSKKVDESLVTVYYLLYVEGLFTDYHTTTSHVSYEITWNIWVDHRYE